MSGGEWGTLGMTGGELLATGCDLVRLGYDRVCDRGDSG